MAIISWALFIVHVKVRWASDFCPNVPAELNICHREWRKIGQRQVRLNKSDLRDRSIAHAVQASHCHPARDLCPKGRGRWRKVGRRWVKPITRRGAFRRSHHQTGVRHLLLFQPGESCLRRGAYFKAPHRQLLSGLCAQGVREREKRVVSPPWCGVQAADQRHTARLGSVRSVGHLSG